MFGLTSLGVVHTAISLIAVITGFYALARDKSISPRNTVGKFYIGTTILTCLTGFGIFQHGGFGKPHALGIITLVVLAVAWMARTPSVFGRGARYVETIGYSLTLFFHMVPAITETATRLPLGSPLFSNPDDPAIQKMIGAVLLVFVCIFISQAWMLRSMPRGKSLDSRMA